ncbi:MAG: hypothetical protein K5866_04425 [Treponema sp.]|nr:hypothetical protein [Treponema sp.]
MKKHKNIRFIFNRLFFSFCLILSTGLLACKSAPEAFPVEAMDLLDLDSEFYISIPSQADPDLIKYFLQKNIENINGENIDLISQRINTIYCGILHEKKSYKIQAAVDESIPANFASRKIKKIKAIDKIQYEVDSTFYDSYNYQGLEISLPSNNLALLGRNLPEMLKKYDSIKSTGYGQTVWENQEIYEFLKSPVNEIRFYSNKADYFLSILIGHQLNLHLKSFKGEFKLDPNYKSQYIVDLDLEFQNEKFMRASRSLLALTFGLTGSDIEFVDSNKLNISNIQIKKELLYKLLIL